MCLEQIYLMKTKTLDQNSVQSWVLYFLNNARHGLVIMIGALTFLR